MVPSQLASPWGFLVQSVPKVEYCERSALKFLTTFFLTVEEISWACREAGKAKVINTHKMIPSFKRMAVIQLYIKSEAGNKGQFLYFVFCISYLVVRCVEWAHAKAFGFGFGSRI